jgi:hypothetical protein
MATSGVLASRITSTAEFRDRFSSASKKAAVLAALARRSYSSPETIEQK